MKLTIKKGRSKKRKKQQEMDCPKENTNVTQCTSDLSSSQRDRPDSTSCIPKRQYVHANARRVGKHLHRRGFCGPLSQGRATGSGSVALGPGHRDAICGEPV